jgi:hypothetical protein
MTVSFIRHWKAVLKSATASAAALVFSAAGAEASRLYLISGTPTSGESLPARLYSVDAGSAGAVKLVSDIASGLSCILVDYEKQVLVVASPDIEPADFSIINMKTPQTKDVRHTPSDPEKRAVGRVFLLDIPERGMGVALALVKVTPPATVEPASSLTFIGLNSSEPPVTMPFDNLKYTRFSGFPGGAITMSQCEVSVRGDPLRVLLGKTTGTGTGIPRPPYLGQRDPNDSYMLIANDSARTVIRPLQPAEPGVIDVLNKTTNEWRRVPIPFSVATMRTFGHWLAAIESRAPATGVQAKGKTITVKPSDLEALKESPGTAKRQSEEITPGYRREPGTTVDDLFQMAQFRGEIFTGELLAHNLDTGAEVRISTGSGDSEILFVNDDAIYYRVDDALYRRQITGSSPGDAVKLAEGPEIVQVHWAFLN